MFRGSEVALFSGSSISDSKVATVDRLVIESVTWLV
jgi:hypothetical protein